MMLYQTTSGPVVQRDGRCHALDRPWDDLVNDDALHDYLVHACASVPEDPSLESAIASPLAPIASQEVWGAGVTYQRSRVARMEEAQDAGGGDFYARVYDATRPEIFFKATPHRVAHPGAPMHLRRDSNWIVPEPELVLAVTRGGRIVGYSIGNDLSCRDIEGENPLYLPQAKTFDRCVAVGPGILVSGEPPGGDAEIRLVIRRSGTVVTDDSTTLAQMKRSLDELVEFLFRDNHHPNGCLFLTGTGIVPADDVTLEPGDVVEISISGIGTLINPVE